MTDAIQRRQFIAGVVAVTTVGAAGCTSPSEEGTPPSTEDPPEGPVADQNGATDQTPGMGPAGGPGEENASSWPDNETDAGSGNGTAGQEGDESGDGDGQSGDGQTGDEQTN